MSGETKEDDDTRHSNGPFNFHHKYNDETSFATSMSVRNHDGNCDDGENNGIMRPRKRRIKRRNKLSVSSVTSTINNNLPIQRNNEYKASFHDNDRRASKKRRCYGSNKNHDNVINENKTNNITVKENYPQNVPWSQRILHRRRQKASQDSSLQKNKNYSSFLPTLLQFRETGYHYTHTRQKRSIFHFKQNHGSRNDKSFRTGSHNCHQKWMAEMLQKILPKTKQIDKNNVHCRSDQKSSSEAMEKWRSYTQRSIPFSTLKTPLTDAILSLDRSGLYMISLGLRNHETQQQHIHNNNSEEETIQMPCNDNNTYHPALSLNFYGVPSAAALSSTFQQRKKRCISPFLLTIPLLYKNNGNDENRNFIAPSSLLGRDEVSSATTTPVHILTTGDSVLGVSILQHSSSSHSYIIPTLPDATFVESPAIQEEDCLGTIVLFLLPFSRPFSTDLVKTFRIENVRINGRNGHTMRNLLWKTDKIPCHSTAIYNENNDNNEQNMNLFETYFNTSCSGDKKTHDKDDNEKNMKLFDSYYNTTCSGYIFFNDEDDGFRILWIEIYPWNDTTATKNNIRKDGPSSKLDIVPKRRDLIIEEDVLDGFWSDARTGTTIETDPKHAGKDDFFLRRHAYFRVDALLCDVLQRRKGSLCKGLFKDLPSNNNNDVKDNDTLHRIILPDFFYNLISFGEDSRTAFIVIVFCNKSLDSTNENDRTTTFSSTNNKRQGSAVNMSPASIGVFIKVDLFDQSYQEISWVQHPSKNDQLFLRRWCNTLAANARMKEMRAGIFSIRDYKIDKEFSGGLVNLSVYDGDNDENEDDYNHDIWRNILLQNSSQKEVQKKISMSSLYPFCDHTTNKAVIEHIPVPYIKARNYPLMLCYG